ncbi:hypothetical protein BJ546DRAFT_135659 [Cryomyces antarcticus]
MTAKRREKRCDPGLLYTRSAADVFRGSKARPCRALAERRRVDGGGRTCEGRRKMTDDKRRRRSRLVLATSRKGRCGGKGKWKSDTSTTATAPQRAPGSTQSSISRSAPFSPLVAAASSARAIYVLGTATSSSSITTTTATTAPHLPTTDTKHENNSVDKEEDSLDDRLRKKDRSPKR